MKIISALVLVTFLNLQLLQAKVLQEGWYQILSGQQHVGYLVQKYEFDESKKQFKFTSFMKTNALGGDVTESVSALSSDGFDPISYQYTTQVGKNVKLIDANFKAGNMTAKVTDNNETKVIQDKLKKGTFLSYFLVYMILQNKSGLKSGASFEYDAIAEEDAKSFKGYADVKEMENINGYDAFKVLTRFKDIKSISHITPLGEVIQVKQPLTGLQLVAATKDSATKGFPPSDKSIKALFGSVPPDSHFSKPKATAEAAPVTEKNVEFKEESKLPKGLSVPIGKKMPETLPPKESVKK